MAAAGIGERLPVERPDDCTSRTIAAVGTGLVAGAIVGAVTANWGNVPPVLADRPWPALKHTGAPLSPASIGTPQGMSSKGSVLADRPWPALKHTGALPGTCFNVDLAGDVFWGFRARGPPLARAQAQRCACMQLPLVWSVVGRMLEFACRIACVQGSSGPGEGTCVVRSMVVWMLTLSGRPGSKNFICEGWGAGRRRDHGPVREHVCAGGGRLRGGGLLRGVDERYAVTQGLCTALLPWHCCVTCNPKLQVKRRCLPGAWAASQHVAGMLA